MTPALAGVVSWCAKGKAVAGLRPLSAPVGRGMDTPGPTYLGAPAFFEVPRA